MDNKKKRNMYHAWECVCSGVDSTAKICVNCRIYSRIFFFVCLHHGWIDAILGRVALEEQHHNRNRTHFVLVLYDSKNISSLCLIAIFYLFRGLLLECLLLKANSVCEVNIVFFLCVVDSWRSWMNNSADHNYFKRFSDLFRRWMRNSEKQHTLEKIVSATTDIA